MTINAMSSGFPCGDCTHPYDCTANKACAFWQKVEDDKPRKIAVVGGQVSRSLVEIAQKQAARIAALEAENERMADRLNLAAQWFDDYAELHRAKGTPEDAQKAKTNAYRAEACRAALAARAQGDDR